MRVRHGLLCLALVCVTGATKPVASANKNPTCPLKVDWGQPRAMTLTVADKGRKRVLIADGLLASSLERRYPERHDIVSDGALYDYVSGLKSRYMRSAGPLAARDARLRPALLDLAAPIRGLPKDQLDGDDVRQQRRTRRLAAAAVSSIAVAAVLATWQAIEATRQRDRAESLRVQTLSRQIAALNSTSP